MSNDDKIRKARLFLTLALDANRQVRAANEHLSKKINDMIAVNATAISVLLGAVFFLWERKLDPWKLFWLTGPANALLVISIVIGFVTYRPLSFQFMNPIDLIRELHEEEKSYALAVSKCAGSISFLVDKNIVIVNGKARLFKAMLALMMVGFSYVVVSFMVMLLPDLLLGKT